MGSNNLRIKSFYVILIVFIMSLGIIPSIVLAETNSNTATIPEKTAVFEPGLVVRPKIATPAFVSPGENFILILSREIPLESIIIEDGFGNVYRLNYEKINATHYVVTIPPDAQPGLYDLILSTENTTYGEYRCVVVGDENIFKKLYIIHVSDRHFGVISKGKPASEYDLAANLIALALPFNTIIVDTGDLADTAKAQEYIESITIDYILDKPLVGVPGNHDIVGGATTYNAYRGMRTYTLSVFDLYRIVGIDSGSEGYVSMPVAEWVYNVLTKSTEPIKIVFFHHPHFTHMFGDIDYVFTVSSWEELVEILTSKKPGSRYTYVYSSWLKAKDAFEKIVQAFYETPALRVLVFSGHVHLNSYAEVHRDDGGIINYIVTVTTGGSLREVDYHGFRIVEVDSTTGNIEILGDGAYYERHSSFNLDKINAEYIVTEYAATVSLVINNENIAGFLNRTVVAVPLPENFYGKTVGIQLENLEDYKIRCTSLGCVVYGYSSEKPKIGTEYRLTVYLKEDKEPPKIELVRMQPKKPLAGRQVILEFKVTDDAWGVYSAKALLEYKDQVKELFPVIMGDPLSPVIRIVVEPLGKDVEKATVTLIVYDVANHTQAYKTVIEYKAVTPTVTETVSPTETVSSPVTTPSPSPTPSPTTTPTETTPTTKTTPTIEVPSIEVTLYTPEEIEVTTSPYTKPAVGLTSNIVIILVVAAIAVFSLLVFTRKR